MASILVVDDETTIRMTIRMALEFVHHTVQTAADGEEALRLFGDGLAWDLVLLDQRMPGLEGIEVLRRMKVIRPAAAVMMITAFGTIDLAYEAMRSGAVDFLRKPFTAETLRGAVEQGLQAAPVEPVRRGFALTTINGFRFCRVDSGMEDAQGVSHRFEVRNPRQESRPCKVFLPRVLMTLVGEHTRQMPGLDWWQLLCEEVLANYVWQHSDFPPPEVRVEELTSGLRRWIDALLTEAGEAHA